MVHIEMGPAVAASRSTEIRDPIPGTWSPGDEPGDLVKRKKSYCTCSYVVNKSSPPCSTEGRQDNRGQGQARGQDNVRTVLGHVLTLSYVIKRSQPTFHTGAASRQCSPFSIARFVFERKSHPQKGIKPCPSLILALSESVLSRSAQ